MPRLTIDDEIFDVPGEPETRSLAKKASTLFRRSTSESVVAQEPVEPEDAPSPPPESQSQTRSSAWIVFAAGGILSVIALAVALHAARERTLLARLEAPRLAPTPGPRYDERDFP